MSISYDKMSEPNKKESFGIFAFDESNKVIAAACITSLLECKNEIIL